MGKGELKRQQDERSRNAHEAKDVSRCTEENRCRATSPMGKGKSCEKIHLRLHGNEMPGLDNESGLFCARLQRTTANWSGYLEIYEVGTA
jgi:hypothetical protein